MKRILVLMVAFLMLFAGTNCLAAPDVSVMLNDTPLTFDVPAQIINNRTMVPVRGIFEALGCSLRWMEKERVIVATYNEYIIALQIGNTLMPIQNLITGENKTITLDVPPQIVPGDRTLVPIRAISEAFGAKVDWVAETYTVIISR
ncbi:MAG: copper amine oxidase N-terminal domain-containing protein [Clostridia bacterium]|nr:copper amine oxidase N-terminal domain-containing protein [Clostridia bacterium]